MTDPEIEPEARLETTNRFPKRLNIRIDAQLYAELHRRMATTRISPFTRNALRRALWPSKFRGSK